MLFNRAESLTFKDIRNATQIHEEELKRHLLSLSTPHARIINKAPGRCLDDSSTFTINNNFKVL